MKLSVDERLDFYINNTKAISEPKEGQDIFDKPFFFAPNRELKSRKSYDKDILRYVGFSEYKKLWFQCGDDPYIGPEYPVLVKTRDTLDKDSKGIIGNLNSVRHWCLHKDTTPWEDKKNGFIWRGSDTGYDKIKNPRIEFVKKFHEDYDVGFAQYVQNYKYDSNIYLNEYVKGFKSPKEIMSYKYLPIIDGNDKSSSLNYILFSDCVPIMPKPRFHSWLCEKFLLPDVHYVECKPDFSDFLDLVEWCRSNDEKCKKIAENGRYFIEKNFLNASNEDKIEQEIIKYIENETIHE